MRNKRISPTRPKPAINTMEMAITRASRLPDETIQQISDSLGYSITHLGDPELSEKALADLRLACLVSRTIEKMGMVKGLGCVWDAAAQALDAISARNLLIDLSNERGPSIKDEHALREMVEMHIFQLRHVSKAELDKAFVSAQRLAATPQKSQR